jgi:hypothetical protein
LADKPLFFGAKLRERAIGAPEMEACSSEHAPWRAAKPLADAAELASVAHRADAAQIGQ